MCSLNEKPLFYTKFKLSKADGMNSSNTNNLMIGPLPATPASCCDFSQGPYADHAEHLDYLKCIMFLGAFGFCPAILCLFEGPLILRWRGKTLFIINTQ